MKINIKIDDNWEEVTEEEVIIFKRGRSTWVDMPIKRQRPSKKIQGSWYKMGEVEEKC